MSLIKELNERIEKAGYLSLGEVESVAKELSYKMSNAERRLRKSESPHIVPVFGDKKYIIGYRYEGIKIKPLPPARKENQENQKAETKITLGI